MKSLHQQIRAKGLNGRVVLADLKPNSREVALRMIASGELIKTNGGYVYHEAKKA